VLQLLPEDFLSSDSGAAGWYGKIPALGDFASRRLPTEFTATLGRVACTRHRNQPGNARRHLARHILERTVVALRALAWDHRRAVLVRCADASVDRVGRYFPLTIATASALPPSPPLAVLEQWYERAAAAALECLTAGSTVERLESTLASPRSLNFYPRT